MAWVILPNHYHCLLIAPEAEAATLSRLINSAHGYTARLWNQEDEAIGRRVWYQYWDTCITNERSLYARVNYIHHNPVKHGLVAEAADYPHSSYRAWLEERERELADLESQFPWDRIDLER